MEALSAPVSGDEIEVGEEDGTYHCACSGDIEVARGRAVHQKMLAFDCPQGDTEEFVTNADGAFVCVACRSDVRVYNDGEHVRVAHQLHIVD